VSLSAYADALGAARADLRDGRGLVAAEVGVARLVAWLRALRGADSHAVLVGNGGSLSIAQHMACDFWTQAGLRAFAPSDSVLLSALANDRAYATIFDDALDLYWTPGALVIAMSCSGRSENVVRLTGRPDLVTLVGDPNTPLGAAGSLMFCVPGALIGQVQVAHFAILHVACDLLGAP